MASLELPAQGERAAVGLCRRPSNGALHYLELMALMSQGSEAGVDSHPTAAAASPHPTAAAGPSQAPPQAPPRSQHAALQPPAMSSDLQSQVAGKSPPARMMRKTSLRLHSMKSLGGTSLASDGGASEAASARLHQPLAEDASPERWRLGKRCAKAIQLLERLQQPALSARPGGAGAEPLPPAALATCKVGAARLRVQSPARRGTC